MMLIRKINPNARMPTRGTPGSAGLDLYCLENKMLLSGETAKIGLGIATAIPDGHVGIIRPRSSASLRGLVIQGTIDSDYRGELALIVTNASWGALTLEAGKAYAQLLLIPVWVGEITEVDNLDETMRGSNGFGSTDK